MSMRKFNIASLLLAVLLVGSLTACESDIGLQSPGKNPNQTVNEPQAKPDNEMPSPYPQLADPPQEKPAAIKEGKGSFTGLADSHTVEIIVDGQPMALQFGEELQSKLQSIEAEQQVVFQYEEKAIEGDDLLKQLVLKDISISGSKEGSSPKESALPAELKIDVTLEGMQEQRTAKLVHGDGYSFYRFEQFTFDPGRNLLYMNVDPGYQVRIEKLPSGFELEDLVLKGKEELGKQGDVTKLKSGEFPEPMQDARLYLTVQGKGGMSEYIVKELDGSSYVFHVDIPQREASEGFVPLAFASLNTIQNH